LPQKPSFLAGSVAIVCKNKSLYNKNPITQILKSLCQQALEEASLIFRSGLHIKMCKRYFGKAVSYLYLLCFFSIAMGFI
jgi:hypothetical protein